MPTTNIHNATPVHSFPRKKKIRILSIDGGGIKGILPATILMELEKILQQKTGDSQVRLSDYFDFMSGTSTGGILVCSYLFPDPDNPGRPKFTAEEALDLYVKRGDKIFSRTIWQRIRSLFGLLSQKYNDKGLERELRSTFGENTWISSFLKPCLITAYDLLRRRPVFFTSADARKRPFKNFRIWEVARSTSAAPTFFEPALIRSASGEEYPLIDGGVFAPNPSVCACTEVSKMGSENLECWDGNHQPGIEDMMVVSIGTDSTARSFSYDSMKNAGKIGWLMPIVEVLMGGNSEISDYQLHKLCEAHSSTGERNYFRIDPALYQADRSMDNAKEKNLEDLYEAGLKNVERFRPQLYEIADQLIANHHESGISQENGFETRKAG